MPGMTRPATTRQKEDALLARPRHAALLTAGVLALTAVVFAPVADPRTLAGDRVLKTGELEQARAGSSCALALQPAAAVGGPGQPGDLVARGKELADRRSAAATSPYPSVYASRNASSWPPRSTIRARIAPSR
jgi:hypothetical protein